jgi:hypothetical protein
LQSVEISRTATGASALPMNAAWRTIRSYILWQHERGTLHYDIMVTLILIFIFASPVWINFKDKPAAPTLHQTDVVVTPDTQGGLIYEIPASTISPGDDASVREQLMRIIQPISGAVEISKYEGVPDQKGTVQIYRVWVKRK